MDTLFSLRSLSLLKNTLVLGLSVSLITVLLGLFAGIFIYNKKIGNLKIRFSFFYTMLVPFYIYCLSWMYFIRFLGVFNKAFLKMAYKGMGPAVAIECASFLPFVTLTILLALDNLDRSSLELGMIYSDSKNFFYKILIPRLKDICLSLFSFVFIFSVSDFSVPSLFQVNTYTLEIFSVYSGYGDLKKTFIVSIPLILILLINIFPIVNGIKHISFSLKSSKAASLKLTKLHSVLSYISILALCFVCLLPIFIFSVESKGFANIMSTIVDCLPEVGTSILMSFEASILGIIISGALAYFLISSKKYHPLLKGVLWLCILAFVVFPEQLLAILLIKLVNGSVFHSLTRTVLFPAIALAIHYTPIGVVVLYIMLTKLDINSLSMGKLYSKNKLEYFCKIIVPEILPGTILASFLIFLFSFHDEGATIILSPPGKETIAVKIYNYLHYGASEYVSSYCLFAMFAFIVITFCVFMLLAPKKSKN